ncbi:hypothetical protein [Chitinophaga sp. Cy-1792]|uniref:hypothetical protein n=1 Tax=Chitinophaga sp. Cy-1792 TaxID=2608339 RepID=UPI00141FDCA8|nr:hypothetical protein [Chitinophaga sp. Cy-1792]NIG57319.1 hypothetical protein [Chitinophaga sp. Cy-1792]
MNYAHSIAQVIYWLDQGETPDSVKEKQLVNDLSLQEIAVIADACKDYNKQFSPARANQQLAASLSLLGGMIFFIIGIVRLLSDHWLVLLDIFCLFGGFLGMANYVVLTYKAAKDDQERHYKAGRSSLMAKLAAQLQADKQA